MTTTQQTYADASTTLTGRAYMTPDGIAVIGARNERTGMYCVEFPSGHVGMIRPSILVAALDRSGITVDGVEAVAAASAEATAATDLDDETRAIIARWRE